MSRALFCLFLLALLACVSRGSAAGTGVTPFKDIIECDRTPAEETHPMLRLVSGRSKALATEKEVARVIVDHPGRLSVFVKDPKTLDILARKEGGIAHFTAFGRDGKVVMARYVFVGDRAVRYVRAHTAGKESLYYCPNECFEMSLTQ